MHKNMFLKYKKKIKLKLFWNKRDVRRYDSTVCSKCPLREKSIKFLFL